MKKRIITLVLCLVLVLASGIAIANADNNIYTSLGTATAGNYLDCRILGYADGTPNWTPGDLPNGCWIETEGSYEGNALYLRGTPYWAGDYSFTITLYDSEGSCTYVNCTISILPAPVTFGYMADVEADIGSSISLFADAQSADYGAVTLQWYRYQDGIEYILAGENANSLTVDCSYPGSYYYFCRGTNINSGIERVTESRIVAVNVSNPVVSSISVETMPRKLDYNVGDTLDSYGLALLIQYSNGKVDYATSGFDLYPTTLNESGTVYITVSYMGERCRFPVNVQQVKEVISGIGITSFPAKTTYTVGETLNTYGMSVRVYTNVKDYDISSGFSCSPVNFTSAGTQTITVYYNGFSCSFNVTVQAPAAEVISVSVMPKKLSFTVGEKLDTTGLVIAVMQGQNRREIISGFTCSPETLTKEGSQEITVNYNGKTCSFYVTVSPDYSSKPVVTPTPVPQQQGGSSQQGGQSGSSQQGSAQGSQGTQGNQGGQSGTVSGAQGGTTGSRPSTQRESKSVSLLVIILVIAVSALIGLCAYVYIMQHENILDFIENLFSRDDDDDEDDDDEE